eukprot:scaffold33493_cov88-Skeletonema_marinoi.AAC.1
MMQHMQSTNDLSTLFLTTAGFDGSAFKVQIAKKRRKNRSRSLCGTLKSVLMYFLTKALMADSFIIQVDYI